MYTYNVYGYVSFKIRKKQKLDNISGQNICFLFGWFDSQLKNLLSKTLTEFWENKFDCVTQSLTTNLSVRDDLCSKGEIYFTAELSVCPHQNSYIRLSGDFIRILFHETFGSASPVFKLQDLSELEIKILNSYCEFLNENLKSLVIPYEKIPKENLKNKDMYNATFLIGKNKEKMGKVVISMPQNCLMTAPIIRKQNFSMEDFLQTTTTVNILAGTSRLALNDLKNLSLGDIILLENSNVNYMEIKTGHIKQGFKVNPEPSLMLELDEDEHELGADMTDNQNIWDDIQIEVGAEFDKVKMTLGDLKQISKGLVIDLGPIFDNKISLLVENKVVAKGELVIINDKYGVKIDEVYSSHQEAAPQPKVQAKQTAQPQPKPQPQATAKKPTPQAASNQTKKPQAKPAPQPTANPNQVNKMAQGTVKEATGDVEEFDYSDFEN